MTFINLSFVFIGIILQLVCGWYVPTGYIGCFKDIWYDKRVLQGPHVEYLYNNTGNRCKRYCTTNNYRYAGTEYGYHCFCGNNLYYSISSDGCTTRCSGKVNEICGGSWRISIYDTWPCATTNPCRNNAECRDVNATKYVCQCTGNWTGVNCEQAMTTTKATTTTTQTTTLTTTVSKRTKPTTTKQSSTKTSPHPIVISSTTTSSMSTSVIQPNSSTLEPNLIKGDVQYTLITLCGSLALVGIIVFAVIIFCLCRRHRNKNLKAAAMTSELSLIPNVYDDPPLTTNDNNTIAEHPVEIEDNYNTIEGINRNKDLVKDLEHYLGRKDKSDAMHYYANTANYANAMLDYPEQMENKPSYDHVTITQQFNNDDAYSKLSDTKNLSDHPSYSHIETVRGKKWENFDKEEHCDDTYNKLTLHGSPKTTKYNGTSISCPDYDHAYIGVSHQGSKTDDTYSHLHSNECDIRMQNTPPYFCENIQMESKESGDDYVYATVVKSLNKRQ